jgi:hypothetical protein
MGFIKLDDEFFEKMRKKRRPEESPPSPQEDTVKAALKELGKNLLSAFSIL